MVVCDCCPFTYAPLVKRPPSSTQGVVLLFYVIVSTNGFLAELVPRQSVGHLSFNASYRVCVCGVAVSFDHDVRTCRRAGGKLFSSHHFSGQRGVKAVAESVLA